MSERPPTIYDVAKAAGVAASTVSRAFARPGRVNFATAERIRRVAAELGYRVSPLARGLSAGRTSMIGLGVADIGNPFYTEIIRGAQDAAAEAGYTLLVTDARESGAREREALERAVTTVDGLVLATSRMSDSAIRAIAKQRPVVVLNRAVTDVPSVLTDTADGMRRVVEHLAGLGHEGFTYVAGPEASWADGMRWRSLRELAPGSRRLGPYAPSVPGGGAAAADFLRAPSSAVVTYNDAMAIGLIRRLTVMGVRVPRDVSVVSFDNVEAAELVTPALTTVATPLRAMGRTAVVNVLAIANGAVPHTTEPMVLPSRLVVRASTARREKGGGRAVWEGPAPHAERRRNRTSPAWGTTNASGSSRRTADGSR
ncbi:LacI family transcriptional regulator [Paractinoplanes deccanensis]|uniref:LacI family transcriptional regulator n=1 Tax=Paractinoplanes deccanensis TaxID=113561 RepID=A0ABQ3YB04_9ACTN|nr:LacI family DNA-binding transcriptional regulator [Actinoplanes deccanensis]GID77197.1 LacI family transcriptional regulator [Actinoplanes deccanensis]